MAILSNPYTYAFILILQLLAIFLNPMSTDHSKYAADPHHVVHS